MHGGGKTLNNPWLARFVYNAATSLNVTARRPVDSSLLPTASETSTHYIGTMAGHGRGAGIAPRYKTGPRLDA